MFSKLSILTGVAMGALSFQAPALTLIDATTNNGSFEMAGGVANTDKVPVWDGDPDIDNWVEWAGVSTAGTDSGVENTGNASDGTMIAFLQPGNAVHNMTSYVAQEGDIFDFSWDHVLCADRTHTVGLAFDDGGTIVSVAASEVTSDEANGVAFTYTGSYTVLAGDPIIGKTVGLGLVSPGSYPEVDNFQLSVVPEPTSFALLLAGAGLMARRRRQA